jgi:hypothetical protein
MVNSWDLSPAYRGLAPFKVVSQELTVRCDPLSVNDMKAIFTFIVIAFIALDLLSPARTPGSHKFVFYGIIIDPGIPLTARTGVNIKIIFKDFHLFPPCTGQRDNT